MTPNRPNNSHPFSLDHLGLKPLHFHKPPDLRQPGNVAAFLADKILARSRRSRLIGALYVDRDVAPLGCAVPYVGYLDEARVEPRRLLAPGLVARHAVGVILFQQRPKARAPLPDKWDAQLTEAVRDAGEVVGLRLLDHLVLGQGDAWTSLKREEVVHFHALGEDVIVPALSRALPYGDRRRRVKPKYVNPDRPTETWSGRGKFATWLVKKLEDGADLEDFLVRE